MVLLASVLKPVDDTRMRGKFAETFISRPNTQVHVAGRGTKGEKNGSVPNAQEIQEHPIFNGSRLSLGRLAAQVNYWRLLQQIGPSMVVVHAPELLPLTMLWQRLAAGRKFIYDIRENYALNVSTQRVYHGITRRWLAAGLRWVETLAARRAAGIILAEASYAEELPFLQTPWPGRVVVLENKYQAAPREQLPTQPRMLPLPENALRLLFSGTISEINGVWEAIVLAEKLHYAWPGGAHLTIIGFCQQPALLRQLEKRAAQNLTWLTLLGGAEPVPHARIIAAIQDSHVGLLPYRPHLSTERCRPTKLFEYLAHGLPVIASPNLLWQESLQKYGAGLQLDFAHQTNGPCLVNQLRSNNFYPLGIPTEVLWAGEGKKLRLFLDSLV